MICFLFILSLLIHSPLSAISHRHEITIEGEVAPYLHCTVFFEEGEKVIEKSGEQRYPFDLEIASNCEEVELWGKGKWGKLISQERYSSIPYRVLIGEMNFSSSDFATEQRLLKFPRGKFHIRGVIIVDISLEEGGEFTEQFSFFLQSN